VTFDEAETSGGGADASACCDEQPGPNTPAPGQTGPGGGRLGAVVVSPFVRAGTTSAMPYNHYSLLRSLEDIFGLDHLGMAAAADLRPFGDEIYDNRFVAPVLGVEGYRLFASDGGVFNYDRSFAGSL